MRTSALSDPPIPFFTASGEGNRDRLLLISYHFPPGHEAGALRWQKFARYASERGWTLDVVTLAPESVDRPDHGRLAELPPGTRVYGVPEARHPGERFDRVARAVYQRSASRFNLDDWSKTSHAYEPGLDTVRVDEMSQWTRFSVNAAVRAYRAWRECETSLRWGRQAAEVGRRILQSHHGAVISCGPPQEVHATACDVAKAVGLPFVMDMRDAWSLVTRLQVSHASPLWLRMARRLERHAIRQAAIIATTTDHARTALQAEYSLNEDQIITVMNGYDDDPVPHVPKGHRFMIAYVGSIYLDRDPTPLFQAAARVIRRLTLKPHQFAVEFMGEASRFGGVPLKVIARQEGLDGHFRMHPPRPRREALDFLAQASLAVSLPQDSDLAIPSKLFEYMKFDSWILALADRGSATEVLLRNTDADVVSPRDVAGIADVLARRYADFAKGNRPTRLADQLSCSRKSQAQRLFDALEDIVCRPGRRLRKSTPSKMTQATLT